MLNLYRNGELKFTLPVDSSSTHNKTVMGENVVNLRFEFPDPVEIRIGDTVQVFGETFTLRYQPKVREINSKRWEYSCVFAADEHRMETVEYLLLDNTPTKPEGMFSLTADVKMFLELLTRNMARVGVNWELGELPETDTRTLTFENHSCWNALVDITESFNGEYYFDKGVLHFAKKEIRPSILMEYGKERGLTEISRSPLEETPVITRLYASGGERNLPDGYGDTRLNMPVDYVEKDTDLYGIHESAQIFEDIYPRLQFQGQGSPGSITDIDVAEPLKVYDRFLDFDINDQLAEGLAAKIVFRTGQLSGYEFEITAFDNSTKQYTLKAIEEEGMNLPNESIRAQVGDTYVLVDIFMPQTYVDRAELELQAAAESYLADYGMAEKFNIKPDPIFISERGIVLDTGQIIRLKSNELAIERDIRVVSFIRNINEPYIYDNVEVSDVIPYTKIQQIENQQAQISQTVNNNTTIINNIVEGNVDLTIGGDLTGPLSNLKIKDNVVTDDKIGNRTVDGKTFSLTGWINWLIVKFSDYFTKNESNDRFQPKGSYASPSDVAAAKNEAVSTANTYTDGKVAVVQNNLNSHITDKNNPHNVTAGQIGAATPSDILTAKNEAISTANTYTDTQLDNLQIGVRNYLSQSGQFGSSVPTWWVDNGGGIAIDTAIKWRGFNTLKTTVGNGITGQWIKLENGVNYTYSALIWSDSNVQGWATQPLFFHAGYNNQSQSKYQAVSFNSTYKANQWNLVYVTFRLTQDADSFKPYLYFAGGSPIFNVAYLKLEKGDKATDWLADTDEKISDIQIGGRNYVRNSLVNLTTNGYGVGTRMAYLKKDTTYLFSANGRVDQQAITDGKHLEVFIYNDAWSFSRSFPISTLTDSTKSMFVPIPADGWYNVSSYLYPSGGSRAGTVTINWYHLEIATIRSDWRPAIEDYYTKTDADGLFQPKGSYASPSDVAAAISTANTYTDNKLGSYFTKTDSDNRYQPKGSYASPADVLAAKNEAISTANTYTDTQLTNYQAKGNYVGYSSWEDMGGAYSEITTDQFLTLLEGKSAFTGSKTFRGRWDYTINASITDTGYGKIHLAGAVVKVNGTSRVNCTIEVITATTSINGNIPNAQFIYVNNGAGYSPGWRRIANFSDITWNKIKPELVTADYLQSINIRDISPSYIPSQRGVLFFVQNSQISIPVGGYSDLLTFNGWHDSSGGNVTAIAVTKSGTPRLFLLAADRLSSSWTVVREITASSVTESSGVFTPYVEGITMSYASRTGSYYRVGNMVFLDVYIRGTITAISGDIFFIKGTTFGKKFNMSLQSFSVLRNSGLQANPLSTYNIVGYDDSINTYNDSLCMGILNSDTSIMYVCYGNEFATGELTIRFKVTTTIQ